MAHTMLTAGAADYALNRAAEHMEVCGDFLRLLAHQLRTGKPDEAMVEAIPGQLEFLAASLYRECSEAQGFVPMMTKAAPTP